MWRLSAYYRRNLDFMRVSGVFDEYVPVFLRNIDVYRVNLTIGVSETIRGRNYLFLNVVNGTEIITQLHDLLYSNEFGEFDLGIPYMSHMTVGKLKNVDDLNNA